MERLSSCYFCGDAVDAALESYPLVPDEHHPDIDTDREVVLCSSCRRKLTTVLEHVLEAAFEDSAGPAIDDSTEILHDVDAGDPMSADRVERLDAGDGSAAAEDDGPGTNGRPDSAGADGPGESDPEGDDPWVTPGDSAADTGNDGSKTGADGDDGRPVSEDEPAEASSSGTTDTTGAGEGRTARSGGDSGSDGESQYSRSEYNRIVRLLQNRDFPVEIDEIEVVARNAYGIDEATCHAVLQALVDRGVVADRGEELVKT